MLESSKRRDSGLILGPSGTHLTLTMREAAIFISVILLTVGLTSGVTDYNRFGVDCTELCLTEAVTSSTNPAETLRIHKVVKMINTLKQIRIRNEVNQF